MSEINRHVVVLGGAGGIGRAIVKRFAQSGCTVYVMGRNIKIISQFASETGIEYGTNVIPIECDVENPLSISKAFSSLPRIDVLANAAGSIPRMSLLETTPEDWKGSWSGKVFGAIESTRIACQLMKDQDGGVIVHIIGVAGIKLNPRSILTSTANAALISFTEAIGSQSVDWNVRVVGINPGMTATPRVTDMLEGRGGEAYSKLLADLPFKRMANANEIAECTWFLASDHAKYISGTVIDVDGGTRWRN